MKKVLSLVLVIAMVLSSMSFAFASNFTDIADNDYEKAIETLTALGIIDGYEDGTFRPEKTITRAEIAKILVESLGYGQLVEGSTSQFPDTKGHWADGYVAIAAGTGLVQGYPNGTFLPDQAITYNEVYTMVIRALGYTDASLRGTWPTNYIVKAIDLKLNKDVAGKVDADRGGVTKVIANALEATLVEVNEDNVAVKLTSGTVAGGDYKEVILIDKIAQYEKAYAVTPDLVDPESNTYAGNHVDLNEYMYQSIKAYLNTDDEVVFVKGTNDLVVTGTLTADYNIVSATVIDVLASNDKDYTFNLSGASFMVNGSEYKADGTTLATWGDANYTDTDVKVTVVLDAKNTATLKNNIVVKGLVAEKQTDIGVISDIYVTGKTNIDKFDLPVVDKKVDLDNVVVTGDVDVLEDIEKDDVVVEYATLDGSKTKLVVAKNTIEGLVTRVDGASTFYIDGVKHQLNGGLAAAGLSVTLSLGSEGTFTLDHNDNIVKFKGTASAAKYAVVRGIEQGELTSSFGTVSVKDYPQVKLATADGEVVVYDLYVKVSSDKKITESAQIGSTANAFAGSTVYNGTENITEAGFAALGAQVDSDPDLATVNVNKLVSYKLNKDGKIVEIKEVGTASNFDNEKSNFIFASNATVFDANDTYKTISADRLKANGNAIIYRNTSGQIVAMVTMDVKAGTDSVFAYISKVNAAYNSNKDDVQFVVAYLNGEKVEYLTDDVFSSFAAGSVYALDLDGEVITNRTPANTKYAVVTASAISTGTNSFEISGIVSQTGVSPVLTTGQRLFLTDDATIITIDGTTVEIDDLYDIRNKQVEIYLNSDNDVTFIIMR